MARGTLPDDLVVQAPQLAGDALKAAQRGLLREIDADEQELARLYVRMALHRAEVARLWAGSRPGSGVLELAGTAHIGQDRATRQVEDGLRLVECFPRAVELLGQGRMLVGTVTLLLSVTKNLSARVQAQVGARVCEEIAGLDAADARQVVVTAVAEVVDAEQARKAHERARVQRGVWVKPVEDGMARIGAEVDQVSARRFALDLEELVRAQKVQDDRAGRRRSTQQRRADVLAELPGRHLALIQAIQQGRTEELLAQARAARGEGGAAPEDLVAAVLALPVRNPAIMHVHVPVTTVLDLDQRSAVIEGLGVVPAFQARLLRPVASLARLWVDADTGVPLGMDPDVEWPPEPGDDVHEQVRRRLLAMLRPTAIRDDAEPHHDPSGRLRRLVEVRDQRCDGPGCAVPARACELDHEQEWADEGPTAVWNLKARSPRCHHGKHEGWSVERHRNGSSTWTSPTGRTYRRRGAWRPPPLPPYQDLPEARADRLDDIDPREDWHLPLWRGDDRPAF